MKKIKYLSLNIIIIVLLLFTFFPDFFNFSFIPQKVVSGVKTRGIDLSGLNWQEGLDKLHTLEAEIQKTKITLQFENKTYKLPVNISGVSLDKQAMMKHAMLVGHRGSLFSRWSEQRHIKNEGMEIPVKVHINNDILEKALIDITSDITISPRDATIKVNADNEIEIIPSISGLKADPVQTCMKMISILETGQKEEINLKLVSVDPEHSTREIDAMGINTLLSAYRTEFQYDNIPRAYNIGVAASALDGILVPPDKIISFNEIVGPRSTEAGYKDAGVIFNNELVQAPGGGVCQVSTTLYNSVLLAGLEVVERTNHSLPVSYVPIGRDATVVYETVDFKFRNNTKKYIYLKTITEESSLTVKVFGNNEYKRDVELQTWITGTMEPETVYESDVNLKKGQITVKQEGSKGYYAEGIRVIYNKGIVEAKKTLPQSKYKPVNKIITVGVSL